MKAWFVFFGLVTCANFARADDCGATLDESSPSAAYLVYYDPDAATPRNNLTDDLERKYADDYHAFEKQDLRPFLARQFPSAVARVKLFAYPTENMVVVEFPEDRVPVFASMKAFERSTLWSVRQVRVTPKDALFVEPERIVTDDPSEYRDFMIVYHSSLQPSDGTEAFDRLSEDFVTDDLRPWLDQTFPEIAARVKLTRFPHLNSVNVRFPKDKIPSVRTMKALEGRHLRSVTGLEVFNGP